MSQQNQNAAAKPPSFELKQILDMLTPDGQHRIAMFLRECREQGGPKWLEGIKTEFPFASWLVDLVANHTADEAVDQIAALYPNLPINFMAGNKLKQLHAKLLYEIEVKR